MSYFDFYPAEEPVTWKAYNSSYSLYDSDGRPCHSNSVALYVSMCCEKCVQKVNKSLKNVDDIESVDVDIRRQRVVVRGHVNPDSVLRKVQKQNKSATFWDSYDDYANHTSEVYEYYRPTTNLYHFKYYGARTPSNSYATYTSGAYDYHPGTSTTMDNYSYYDRSPTYVYSDGYPSSPKCSRHNHYNERYPSYSEYTHNDYPTYSRSYDTYRSYR